MPDGLLHATYSQVSCLRNQRVLGLFTRMQGTLRRLVPLYRLPAAALLCFADRMRSGTPFMRICGQMVYAQGMVRWIATVDIPRCMSVFTVPGCPLMGGGVR